MSELKVRQIRQKLLELFEPYLDLSDLKSSDPQREVKVLSRCLAALAVYLAAGCSEADAAAAVWDGSDDNGIDAAYFDPSDSQVLLVQAKWINKGSSEPDASDIGTFTKGVRDVVEQDQTAFDDRLAHKVADIFNRLHTPGTSVRMILISTGASCLARHGQSRIDSLLLELNGSDPDPIAFSQVIGLTEIYKALASDLDSKAVDIEATILDWSFISQPYKAYYGIIDGLQLKTLWSQHGKRLVSANIRHSLGGTDVNSQIRQTASNTPELFWYFNNGITMIAEKAEKAPAGAASRAAGQFTFKAASIVNGAQTVSSLSKVSDDSQLGLVRVPLRVILLSDAPPQLGGEVTRTNNLQNRIEARDFVAQDPQQNRLRMEMSIEGIDYQYVRSEETSSTPTSCDLIELTTALACASGDPKLAVQVKTGISRIFADLKRAPYKALFNPSLSGARAFNVTLVQREIDKWIEDKKRSLPKKSGTGWGLLIHGNRILAAAVFAKVSISSLEQPISEFPSLLPGLDVPALCLAAYEQMVAEIQLSYPTNFLAVLFKNPSMSQIVYDAGVT